jgi:hypothetical protein
MDGCMGGWMDDLREVQALGQRAPGLNGKHASDILDSETSTTQKLHISYYVYKAFAAL